jgi:hypothetical protein
VLHATAVAFDGVAVAFVGRSGAGKSTLAAAGVAAGGRLLADDTLLLASDGRSVTVRQTAARGRLRTDVAAHLHQPPDLPHHDPAPVRLGLICLLERGAGHLTLAPCPPSAALVALAQSAFVPEAHEVDRASVLDRFLPVVEATPVAWLRYPDGLHQLPEAVELVRPSAHRHTTGATSPERRNS